MPIRASVLQSVKKLPTRPRFWYNKGNGGAFMEQWRKDARREVNAEREKSGKKPIEDDEDDNDLQNPTSGGTTEKTVWC